MLGVRASSFSEGSLGEPEQDANSALTELDKALRSEKIGEQCEAIVRFPRLFEKYPFPILINSSLLKLADVFRVGNNFLRLWVLRVCQQSEKHLDKIINVDEFVRRIYSVIHSNDPVARALTLRTLGSVAGIIPERQQVHHSIRNSLDSHDEVEVNATIYAAMQFAAQSKTFAVSMCNKISDMIQGLSTPSRMKLQLIPILQHMHHDISTATMVRQLCTKLLPSYPGEEFVLVTLNTLTQLASASLVHIPSQVTLLLQYLDTDPRWAVKAQALRNLHLLAGQGAHLWPPSSVASMVAVALNEPNERFLGSVLNVLLVLAKSPAACVEQLQPDSALMELCDYSCYMSNPAIATKGIQVMTRVVRYCSKEDLPLQSLSAMVAKIESVFLLIMISRDQPHVRELKMCLNCAVSLCKVYNELCPRVVRLIGSTLMESDSVLHEPLLCEALAAIGDLKAGSLLTVLPDVLDKLTALSDVRRPKPEEAQTKVMLCTLVFQTMTEYKWDTGSEEETQQLPSVPSETQPVPSDSQPLPSESQLVPSERQQLPSGSQAMPSECQPVSSGTQEVPYGSQPLLSEDVMMQQQVLSEGGPLMLTAEMLQVLEAGMQQDPEGAEEEPEPDAWSEQSMEAVSQQEPTVCEKVFPRRVINQVVLGTNLWANYRIARSAARYSHHAVAAAVYRHLHEQVSSEHLHFWLKALQELSLGEAALIDREASPSLVDRLGATMVHYCKAVVALKAASTPASNLQFQTEYTRLRLEFLQCLAQLAHSCHSLCTTPPPAVATAIPENNLQRYGHITNQLRKCVKEFRTCGEMYWKLYQSAFDADPASLANIQILQQMCVLMAHSVERVAQSNYQDEAVLDFSCEHASLEIQYLISCCRKACGVAQQLVWNEEQKTITHQHMACLLEQVNILADSSLCLPRYFFQVLQSTTITLMVTPKPRVIGESISVMNNSQLAVKVEGVIQHGKRPGLFRSVSQVMVTVTSQLQKQYVHDAKGREGRDSDSVMTQTISPHRDFFSAQFLLSFPIGGQYVLQVEAAVIDDKSNVWRTGSKINLAVKSLEDSKTSGQAAATSRANFPLARF